MANMFDPAPQFAVVCEDSFGKTCWVAEIGAKRIRLLRRNAQGRLSLYWTAPADCTGFRAKWLPLHIEAAFTKNPTVWSKVAVHGRAEAEAVAESLDKFI